MFVYPLTIGTYNRQHFITKREVSLAYRAVLLAWKAQLMETCFHLRYKSEIISELVLYVFN